MWLAICGLPEFATKNLVLRSDDHADTTMNSYINGEAKPKNN